MFYFSNHTILPIAVYFFQSYSGLIRIVVIVLLYTMVFCPESANLGLISGIENFNGLILSTLLPVKPKGLTKKEREEFVLSEDLKGILVGLLLGDLHINKQ